MTGRITKLIEHQQFGTIAGDDGEEYAFHSRSLHGVSFGALSLGTPVAFEPYRSTNDVRRANAVRLAT